jgi:cardiolipin synthase
MSEPFPSGCFSQTRIEEILGIPFTADNYVRLLKSGAETFQTIFDSVSTARHSICIEFYIFKDDDTGRRLADLLKEKSRHGVKVYLLYDHFGSFMTSRSFWSDMKKAGINLRVSRPFRWSSPGHYIHRNHKKLLIIDGQKAFTGGFNIADEYHGYLKIRKLAWRDTGIYLEGPIAQTLFEIFSKSWIAWRGEPIIQLPKIHAGNHRVPVIPIFSNSARSRRRLRQLFFYSINNARERILITTAYFTPSRRILMTLEDAVQRGVKVKILLPDKSDLFPVDYVARASYTKLLKAGIEVYTYQGKILHAKTAVFDDCWSIVGSANLDFQSLRRNDEGNVGILGEVFARQLTEVFEEDLSQSVKMDPILWAKRSLYEKVLEGVFSVFRKRL